METNPYGSIFFFFFFAVVTNVDCADINWAVGRPTYQSSFYQDRCCSPWTADLVVDGDNQNTNLYANSCFLGNDAPGGPNWIIVDMGDPFFVSYVAVTTRGPGNYGWPDAAHINYFVVGVTNISPHVSPPIRDEYPLCGQYPSTIPVGARVTLSCRSDLPAGQFVILQQPANYSYGALQLCEFEIYGKSAVVVTDVNLAYGRPASISSAHVWYTALSAPFAVDGFYDTQLTHSHCACTNDPQGGPNWLSVDLGRMVQVDYVAVTNRGDGGWGYRLNYAIVGLMNDMPTLASVQRGSYPMCALLPKIVPDGARVTQRCNARAPASRFVIIQQSPTGDGYMTICELEVYEMTKNKDQLMWNFVTGFRIANHVIARPVVNNPGACTRACQSFGVCGSINFRSTDNRCELNHLNGYVSTDIVADPKWKYGSPVFFLASSVRSSPPNRWANTSLV